MTELTKIKQITIKEFDERFYELEGVFKPSVTFILGVAMPSSPHLTKWIAETGYEEAEAIKNKAGDEGSQVHNAIDRMLRGEIIPTLELSLKVKRSIQAFIDWYAEENPEIIDNEYIIWGPDYAGTVDLLCKIKSDNYKDVWLIDYKSSKSIHDAHKAQVEAYKHADLRATKGAILHLGNTTKKGFTFSEIKESEKYWNMFETAKKMFQILRPNARPTEEKFPLNFMLQNRVKDLQ